MQNHYKLLMALQRKDRKNCKKESVLNFHKCFILFVTRSQNEAFGAASISG